MPRAANDVMQSIIFSAILDALAALKRASGGLPNQLLRDVQAIHPNVTFADLPKELQDAIAESTRAAFTAAAEGRLCRRPAPADPGRRGRWTACPSANVHGRRGPPRGPPRVPGGEAVRRGRARPRGGGGGEAQASRAVELERVSG